MGKLRMTGQMSTTLKTGSEAETAAAKIIIIDLNVSFNNFYLFRCTNTVCPFSLWLMCRCNFMSNSKKNKQNTCCLVEWKQINIECRCISQLDKYCKPPRFRWTRRQAAVGHWRARSLQLQFVSLQKSWGIIWLKNKQNKTKMLWLGEIYSGFGVDHPSIIIGIKY